MTGSPTAAAFAKSNRIPTTKGWKTVGELRKYDKIFDVHGNQQMICEVRHTDTLGMRIRLADGRSYICSEYTRIGSTMTAHDAMRCLNRKKYTGGLPCDFHKAPPDPAKYGKKIVPVPPYDMGILCGGQTEILPDKIVLHDIRRDVAGQMSLIHRKPFKTEKFDSRDVIIDFIDNQNELDALAALYRNELYFVTKYIAREYMENSVESRQQLLAGITDVAGCPLAGCCRFRGLDIATRFDVIELANSLGMIAKESANKDVRIFSKHVPSQRPYNQKHIAKITPPANAGHIVIRRIECLGYVKSVEIKLWGECDGILIENYIPALI